jgi:hypothetical protein
LGSAAKCTAPCVCQILFFSVDTLPTFHLLHSTAWHAAAASCVGGAVFSMCILPLHPRCIKWYVLRAYRTSLGYIPPPRSSLTSHRCCCPYQRCDANNVAVFALTQFFCLFGCCRSHLRMQPIRYVIASAYIRVLVGGVRSHACVRWVPTRRWSARSTPSHELAPPIHPGNFGCDVWERGDRMKCMEEGPDGSDGRRGCVALHRVERSPSPLSLC